MQSPQRCHPINARMRKVKAARRDGKRQPSGTTIPPGQTKRGPRSKRNSNFRLSPFGDVLELIRIYRLRAACGYLFGTRTRRGNNFGSSAGSLNDSAWANNHPIMVIVLSWIPMDPVELRSILRYLCTASCNGDIAEACPFAAKRAAGLQASGRRDRSLLSHGRRTFGFAA